MAENSKENKQALTPAELAEALRKYASCGVTFTAQIKKILLAAAEVLSDDTLEQNAKRYWAIKALKHFNDPKQCFLVRDDWLGIHSCHMSNTEFFTEYGTWYPTLDAALDAWIEGEKGEGK